MIVYAGYQRAIKELKQDDEDLKSLFDQDDHRKPANQI